MWHRFSLGFSITVLLDPEREMFDGSVLLMVETVALSLACALEIVNMLAEHKSQPLVTRNRPRSVWCDSFRNAIHVPSEQLWVGT